MRRRNSAIGGNDIQRIETIGSVGEGGGRIASRGYPVDQADADREIGWVGPSGKKACTGIGGIDLHLGNRVSQTQVQTYLVLRGGAQLGMIADQAHRCSAN